MSKPHHIVFTGGTGFLGSHLLRQLVNRGERITLIKRSTSNLTRIDDLCGKIRLIDANHADFEELFSKTPIDEVIHCATSYGTQNLRPWETIEANLVLPLKLLDFSKKYGVRTFINTDTILDKRISHYSLSKGQFLDWLNAYSNDLVCINVALEHFYGPGDDRSKFVSKMIESMLQKTPVIDLTEGAQKRDFIHVEDVVAGFLRIIDWSRTAEKKLHKFEMGSGESLSIRDFVCLIQHLIGDNSTRLNFGAIPYRRNEIMESKVDLTHIKSLGWFPKVSLTEGLRRTIEEERGNRV